MMMLSKNSTGFIGAGVIGAGVRLIWTLLFGAMLTACGTGHDDHGGHDEHLDNGDRSKAQNAENTGPKPQLGLMTSLPLYWPIGADFGDLASGSVPSPPQRAVFETAFELVPLDTLSPIASITQGTSTQGTTSEGEPDKDPLGDLTFLAVIQPRVLTPSDNVALDNWVREGGQLLLVLDPALAGHYPLPLGDPRRPVEAALIPPVLARWGLAIQFDETQTAARTVQIAGTALPTMAPGTLSKIGETRGSAADCRITVEGLIAQCSLGEGTVTVLADAESFKSSHSPDGHGAPTPVGNESHQHSSGHGDEARTKAIQMLMNLAFETE